MQRKGPALKSSPSFSVLLPSVCQDRQACQRRTNALINCPAAEVDRFRFANSCILDWLPGKYSFCDLFRFSRKLLSCKNDTYVEYYITTESLLKLLIAKFLIYYRKSKFCFCLLEKVYQIFYYAFTKLNCMVHGYVSVNLTKRRAGN